MSGPSGLGAAQDVLGTLPPQGPEALRPERVYPGESRGGSGVRPQIMWLGVGISQWRQKEKEDKTPGVK